MFFKRRCLVLSLLLSLPIAAQAQDFDNLDSMSFESLGNIVTSVSKRPEDSFKSAAAITVITQEDIKLSGATHVAEVLRMVPGLNVARADSSNWAITSRGFNATTANKLLVLVDGRTIYTPLFSGVYWDMQDMILEDIDRIEVIRGPGATQWGANAVNGVINIITKRAEQTQGAFASQLIGTEDRSITEARYGGAAGEGTFYRAYARYAEHDASEDTTGANGQNDWNNGRAGFRVDHDVSSTRKITLQGDMTEGNYNLDLYPPSTTPPFFNFVRDDLDARNANLLGRWTETHGDGFESTFQVYYDFQNRQYSQLNQDIQTFDFDYQTAWQFNDRHSFVWGAGYRLLQDDLQGSPALSFMPQERTTDLYNAFFQDTIAIVPKVVDLTLGSKFEHNDYTGFEVQPSARVSWYPTNEQTVWGAISRSVRTPSRAEDDIQGDVAFDPSVGVLYRQDNDRGMDSEELIAYEVGYRVRPTNSTMLDITAFYNDYDDLRTFEFQTPTLSPGGFIIVPVTARNLGEGSTYGTEISGTWDVTPQWSLTAAYSYLQLRTKISATSSDISLAEEEGKIPNHQFNLRSQYYLTDDIDITNTIYYVDKLQLYNIDDYVRFDTRIGYKVMPGVDLDLVGQNLFSSSHAEFGAPLYGLSNEIERNLYARVTFRY